MATVRSLRCRLASLRRFLSKRNAFLLILTLIFVVMMILLDSASKNKFSNRLYRDGGPFEHILDDSDRNFTKEGINQMSILARMLYFGEKPPEPRANKNFTILVWKYGKDLERKIMNHVSEKEFRPFESCRVKNCNLTYHSDDINSANLVLFPLDMLKSVDDLPSQEKRDPKQIWTFLTDSSPFSLLESYPKGSLKEFNNIFNWSMTYSVRSDVPVPFGWKVRLDSADDPFVFDLRSWIKSKKDDVLISMVGSDCDAYNNMWAYVDKLKEEMRVDVYGKCGTVACPGDVNSSCESVKDYMFYLAFEDSNCDEYITEKLWSNAYLQNTIPIVMGAPESSLEILLPPQSYINVENFATPRDLARYIKYLLSDLNELQTYFNWKKDFKVVQEHRRFYYCRICEALNYNEDVPEIYDDMDSFWSLRMCHPNWDVQYD